MTPERLKVITTRFTRKAVATLLGYVSEASLRQCEDGKQRLPSDKGDWLESYVAMKDRQAKEEAAWIAATPPPPVKYGPRVKKTTHSTLDE